MKKLVALFVILGLILSACEAVVAGEAGTLPMPGQAPAIPQAPALPQAPPASAPLEPPAIIMPQQEWELPQQGVPDSIPWEYGNPAEEVLQRFAEAKPAEGEGADSQVDVETDPNRLNQRCSEKPGIPPGSKSQVDVLRNAGNESVIRYVVDPDGYPVAQGVLSRLHMPSGSEFITHNITVYQQYAGRGVAEQLMNMLNQDWIREFPGEAAKTKVAFINLHPSYPYRCYWRDKVKSDDVQDWDGESWYPTHWLIPPGLL